LYFSLRFLCLFAAIPSCPTFNGEFKKSQLVNSIIEDRGYSIIRNAGNADSAGSADNKQIPFTFTFHTTSFSTNDPSCFITAESLTTPLPSTTFWTRVLPAPILRLTVALAAPCSTLNE
jgi:hypothetical protein